jgi:hypothetical protein
VTAEDTAMYYCASDPVRELQCEPKCSSPFWSLRISKGCSAHTENRVSSRTRCRRRHPWLHSESVTYTQSALFMPPCIFILEPSLCLRTSNVVFSWITLAWIYIFFKTEKVGILPEKVQ